MMVFREVIKSSSEDLLLHLPKGFANIELVVTVEPHVSQKDISNSDEIDHFLEKFNLDLNTYRFDREEIYER